MNTTEEPKTLTVEIVPPADDKLVVYARETGLEQTATQTLVEAFRPIFVKSRAAIDAARGVAESVKDATCVTEIRQSRACRLALRAVRLESDETRKKHKQHALLYGRAVDGFHNILLADLSPVETSLQEAEDIAEAARKAALAVQRRALLLPLGLDPILYKLDEMTAAQFTELLDNTKLAHQAKLDAAAKVESDRVAKEKADAEERERVRAENERLKKEAIEREAAAKAEREAAEKKLADERKEAARIAAEIKAKADAAAKEAAEKAAQERAAVEAKAKAEREESERKAAAERELVEAAALKERTVRLKLEAEAKSLREAEAKKKAAEEAAARKAATAPDKIKLNVLAERLLSVPIPGVFDARAVKIIEAAEAAIADVAIALRKGAESL